MIFILTKKCVIENNSFVGYSNSSQRQLTEERRIYLKNYKSTIILALILMFLSIVSLFIGVLEVSPKALFSEDMETIKIFFIKTAKTFGNSLHWYRNECCRTDHAADLYE